MFLIFKDLSLTIEKPWDSHAIGQTYNNSYFSAMAQGCGNPNRLFRRNACMVQSIQNKYKFLHSDRYPISNYAGCGGCSGHGCDVRYPIVVPFVAPSLGRIFGCFMLLGTAIRSHLTGQFKNDCSFWKASTKTHKLVFKRSLSVSSYFINLFENKKNC